MDHSIMPQVACIPHVIYSTWKSQILLPMNHGYLPGHKCDSDTDIYTYVIFKI